jgi:FkbM family methyltransferase
MKASRLVRSIGTYSRILGPYPSAQWIGHRIRRRLGIPPKGFTIHPRALMHPIELRGGASSDSDVFDIIFVEYWPLADLEPRFIIDLGANIGLSSAWFLSRFPNVKLLSVEPAPENFEACCKNLLPYGSRARAVLGAAWPHRTMLSLVRGRFGDGREWATQVADFTSSPDVQGWDILSLMKLADFPFVDLLKVDVEGSELEIFSGNSDDWLPLVRNICIELHGKQCEAAFFGALSGYRYDLSRSGELAVCRNLRRATSACQIELRPSS